MRITKQEIIHHNRWKCDDCGAEYPNEERFRVPRCSICGKDSCCGEKIHFEPFDLNAHSDYPDNICKTCLEQFNKSSLVEVARQLRLEYENAISEIQEKFYNECLDTSK